MSTQKISWEIVLAGIAFSAIAIYMLADNSNGAHPHPHTEAPPPPPKAESYLPSSIVIDLQHIENFKNLENLKHLKNLENLEIELKNLDKIIEREINTSAEEESVEQSLKMVEEKLRQIEQADFQVTLQNKKVYINKDYNIEDSNWTETSPGVFVFRESFPLSGMQSLDLSMAFGNLNIVGSETDQGELTIQATGRVNSAKEVKDNLSILKKIDSPAAVFKINEAGDRNVSDRLNLEATLSIPKSLTLDASTSGGHINANNLGGEQTLFTSGGHIVLNAISGTTSAESSGGHITCDRLSGKATLKTSGGHISVSNADADLTAYTGGGHIEIQDFQGQVDAKTSGGNIAANILSANGPLSFITSAGNISLNIPASLSAKLSAKGNMVTIDEELSFVGNKSKGHISGTLNGGGIPITLTCNYGNVTISNE